MLINLILILPIILALSIIIFEKKWLSDILLVGYTLFHLAVGILYCFNSPAIQPTKYFELDSMNIIFMILLSIVCLSASIYNCGYMKNDGFPEDKHAKYYAMTLIFILSITGAILSNNLELAWVFVGAAALASAYLICYECTKYSVEAARNYVFICSIGIFLAFVGIILVTISAQSMNSLAFNDLYIHASTFNPFWLKLAYVFILFGIGTVMGLAPGHFGIVDAHSQAPTPISVILSAGLLNSAFLVILKVYKIVVICGCSDFARIMMISMGVLSLFVSAVFIFNSSNYKRMLAYSSVGNMGILIIGTALGGIALYASILHVIAHSFIKTSLFLTSGNILKIFGSKKIKNVSALLRLDRKTGWLWIISAFCLSTFAPSLMFLSEFLMIKSMIMKGCYKLCAVFVILLTVIMYGILNSVIKMSFDKPSKDKQDYYLNNLKNITFGMYAPQVVLLCLTVVMGLYIPQYLDEIIDFVLVGFGG